MPDPISSVVTVTLNPAIDRTVTISNFKAGAVNRVEAVRSNPGGKGVNVASALADYGHTVAATGFLGVENATIFADFLAEKGIDDHFVRIPGQTRVAIKITDPVQDETTDINFPGAQPEAGNLEKLREQIDQLAALDRTWFVLAGSIPPGVAPTIYRELITTLRGTNHRIALDVSGEPLAPALEAVPHVIKPNIHELEELLGTRLESREEIVNAARTFIAKGVELVTVSMGAKGALFVTNKEVVMATPPPVKVKSTVGAGDAMVAGIVAARLRDLPLADCACLATAFSLDALVRGVSGITSPAVIQTFVQEIAVS
jgi:1-phosphofructokinase